MTLLLERHRTGITLFQSKPQMSLPCNNVWNLGRNDKGFTKAMSRTSSCQNLLQLIQFLRLDHDITDTELKLPDFF